jgi:hypothetical protein
MVGVNFTQSLHFFTNQLGSKLFLLFLIQWMVPTGMLQAQDDSTLLDLLEEPMVTPGSEKVHSAFKTTKVINQQSLELVDAGVFDFKMSHRFGPLNAGVDKAFGLDIATIRIGGEFGISPNLMLGFGRSNVKQEKNVDLFLKYRLMQQTTDNHQPLSILFLVAIDRRNTQYNVFNPTLGKTELLQIPNSARTGWVAQAIIGKKVSEELSLQFVPGWVKQSTIQPQLASNALEGDLATRTLSHWYLGVGMRQKLTTRTTLNLDFIPILTNKGSTINSFSLGFDIETGGHVFQLQFTNSFGLNESLFIARTTDRWNQAGIRLGFNLSRVFTVINPEVYR